MLVKETKDSSLNSPAFHFHFNESRANVGSARLVSGVPPWVMCWELGPLRGSAERWWVL